MSYLSKLINKIVAKASEGESVYAELHDYKAEIEKQLITLYQSNDLRIFDGDKGGALRGPIKSRKNYEVTHKDNTMIACDTKNVYKTHEVAYLRALFNSRYLGNYNLIAYEAPLMRKLTKDANPEITGRQLACDLVGINSNNICCIEVKIQPFQEASQPSYALLEGLGYCICLNWLLRINPLALSQEIDLCCKSFGVKASNLPEYVSFAIAAPIEDYFMSYWQMNEPNEWFNRRKNEIEIIEEAIFSEYSHYFAGYLALATPASAIEATNINDTERCIPQIPGSILSDTSTSYLRQPFVKRFKTFFQEI